MMALDKDDILFYAPLDGTLDAKIAKGIATPARTEGRSSLSRT